MTRTPPRARAGGRQGPAEASSPDKNLRMLTGLCGLQLLMKQGKGVDPVTLGVMIEVLRRGKGGTTITEGFEVFSALGIGPGSGLGTRGSGTMDRASSRSAGRQNSDRSAGTRTGGREASRSRS